MIEKKIDNFKTVDVHTLKTSYPNLFEKAHEHFVLHIEGDGYSYQEAVEDASAYADNAYTEYGISTDEVNYSIDAYGNLSLSITCDVDVSLFAHSKWDDGVAEAEGYSRLADDAAMLIHPISVDVGYHSWTSTTPEIIEDMWFNEGEKLSIGSHFDGMDWTDFHELICEKTLPVAEAIQDACDAMHTDIEDDMREKINYLRSADYFMHTCDDHEGFFLIDIERNELVEDYPFG